MRKKNCLEKYRERQQVTSFEKNMIVSPKLLEILEFCKKKHIGKIIRNLTAMFELKS